MTQCIIKAPSVNNQVYEQLRHQIRIGKISPGKKTTLREIADEFGVSTTPVREAVRRLQAENFLNVEQRSVTIKKLSQDEVKQTFTIRQRLETLALEWAVPHIRKVDLNNLQLILKQMDTNPISYSEWQQLNRTFHLQIYQFANSQQLYQLIENVWDTVNPYMNIFSIEVDSYEQSQTEHYNMLKLIKEKNIDKLIALLIQHLEQTCQTILAALERESTNI
jgi:DNA-binding GntR family transcriptional regulator